jgi:hypothetical protein
MKEAIEFIRDIFVDWLLAVFHPVKTCRSLLAVRTEEHRIRSGAKIWLASVVVTAVFETLLYRSLGLDFDSLGFQSVSLLWQAIATIGIGFALQAVLRMNRITCRFSDIAAMYVAYFITYQPVIAVLTYLSDQQFLLAMRTVGHDPGGFPHALRLMITQAITRADAGGIGRYLSSANACIFLVFVCVASALFALELAETCNNTLKPVLFRSVHEHRCHSSTLLCVCRNCRRLYFVFFLATRYSSASLNQTTLRSSLVGQEAKATDL